MRVAAQEARHTRRPPAANTIEAKENILSTDGVSTQMFQLFE